MENIRCSRIVEIATGVFTGLVVFHFSKRWVFFQTEKTVQEKIGSSIMTFLSKMVSTLSEEDEVQPSKRTRTSKTFDQLSDDDLSPPPSIKTGRRRMELE
jgi:hypothetical protein